MQITLTLNAEEEARVLSQIAERMAAAKVKVLQRPLSIPEFAKATNQSPNHVRNLIAQEVIRTVPNNSKTLIPAAELEPYR